VPVELPLEPLAAACIESDTACDQRIEVAALGPREIPVADESAPGPADDANKWSDPLDLLALDPQVGKRFTNPRIESRQIDHAPSVLVRCGAVRVRQRTLAQAITPTSGRTGRAIGDPKVLERALRLRRVAHRLVEAQPPHQKPNPRR